MKTAQVKAVMAVLLVLLTAVSAGANTALGTVTLDHTGFGAKGTALITGGGYDNYNAFAGLLKIDILAADGQDNPLSAGTTIGVFCVDLVQSVAGGETGYDVILPECGPKPTDFLGGSMGQEKAALLAELWGRFYDSSWLTDGSYTAAQNNAAEAFQLCVWEIICEDFGATLDISVDGTVGELGFMAANTDTLLANSMLAALDGTGPTAELVIVSNGCYQDFITEVPEPATFAILGFGFAVLAGRRRSA